MKKFYTLFLCLNLFIPSLFAQNCNNWLQINNKLDAVTIGDLDVTGTKLTVEANFNATGAITRSLVSKHTDPSNVNYFLLPDLADITTTSGFFTASATCDFEKNKTYHVAMVYDGTSLKFYRNGFLMDSVPATGNLITNNLATSIGEYAAALSQNNSGIAVPMEGFINEVRIWNVARTQEQIRTYMNSSLPAPSTQNGLLAYYTFDDLTNKQGNAVYNGALHNGATINATNTNCAFIADSCVSKIGCNNWLQIKHKLDAVSIGNLSVTGNKLTVEANFNGTGDTVISLVSKHADPTNVNYFLVAYNAEITTSNGFFIASAPCDLVKNRTYHVAMVYDGVSLKFYRNGFLLDSVPATGDLVLNSLPTTIGEFADAVSQNNSSIAVPMQGFINEVRIWNVARSQSQIRTYMDATLPNPSTQVGLLGYYTFGDLTNKQGNTQFNGTLNRGAVIQATNPDCSFIADSCTVVLPVEITQFDAALQGNSVKLIWKTELETNIVYYSIERSEQGANNYASIGTVYSQHNPGNDTYSFIDNTVQPGTAYNYRIVVYENSGAKKYSVVKSIIIRSKSIALSVFPNPTHGLVNYQVYNFKGFANLTVSNSVGQTVFTRQISVINNQNLQLDLRNQPAGTYWITVKTNDQHLIKKIIHL